jgi:predicted ferric reductase
MARNRAEGRGRLGVWLIVAAIAAVPVIAAALSPLQRGREFLWITGGMAGVVALSLLFVQPLFTATAPVLTAAGAGIRWHRWGGVAIIAMVALHVGALYAYSPEDVMDALLLVAPTPFSLYGVISLWCVILTGALAAARRKLRLGHRRWRIAHSVLAVAIVSSAAVHAVLIEGAMEEISKLAICLAALATTTFGVVEINILGPLRRRRALQGA